MRDVRAVFPVAALLLLLAAPGVAQQAQGLDAAKGMLPSFRVSEAGMSAEFYVYYSDADLMVKLEAQAESALFSEAEFGYLVGDFRSVVSDFFAEVWYSDQSDPAQLPAVTSAPEESAKEMRSPFQSPGATLTAQFSRTVISFTYSGDAPGGQGGVRFTTDWT